MGTATRQQRARGTRSKSNINYWPFRLNTHNNGFSVSHAGRWDGLHLQRSQADDCSRDGAPVDFSPVTGNNKNTSGDEIANVLVNDDIAHT